MTHPPSGTQQTVSLEDAHRLALDHHREGRLDKAEAIYRQLVAQAPLFPDAVHMLGALLHQTGRNGDALPLLQRAVELAPNNAAYRCNLGVVLLAEGRTQDALTNLQIAAETDPQDPNTHFNFGNALKRAGQLDPAVSHYRTAIELRPDHAEAHNNLGTALRERGDLDDAESHFRRALEIRPDYAEALSNLGATLVDQGRFAEAEVHSGRAVGLASDFADAHYNLGNALRWQSKLDDSIEQYRETIQLKPDMGTAYNNLASALGSQGRLNEAIEEYRRAVELCPEDPAFHSNLIYTLQYDGANTDEDLYNAARDWAGRHVPPGQRDNQSFSNPRDPDRQLRIGYVSPDFRRHSVAYFAKALVPSRNPNLFEVTGYDNNTYSDDITGLFRHAADRWREIANLDDLAAAKLIADDGIDILVDLSGHTMKNRMTLFAHRPAPVMVTYLGFPGTTGLDVMDYRLTDRWADPEEAKDQGYTEERVRLDGGFLCYAPPDDAPEVGPLPALAAGRVTFGSFNNLSKITPEVVALWARVLDAVPGSRLVLKNNAFTDPGARQRYEALFRDHGIKDGRVEMLAALPDTRDHLEVYNRIDIGLDTFPYNGTTTTVEALWMGVPTVTLAGGRHAARVGSSLLHMVGLEDLIADAGNGYVDLAASLATDLDRLGDLRSGLRDRLRRSRLLDAEGFTRSLEDAYRRMWRRWCAR